MRRPMVYLLVAVLLSSATTGGISLAISSQSRADQAEQRAESDRRWCALLSDLDDAYQGPPAPTTELGQKVAAEIHRLRVGFGCPQR